MSKGAMQRLNELIREKNSRICAGLDPSWENIPDSFKNKFICEECATKELSKDYIPHGCSCKNSKHYEEVIYEYCRTYISAVEDIVPAIKINSAFFEKEGLESLYRLVATAAKEAGLFVIGDVKRADIGSTSAAYAEAFLGEESPFDAITINPYFGTDGVEPFFKFAKENEKGVFVLVKTSNKSSTDLQDLKLEDGRFVYEAVADLVVGWGKKVDEESYGQDGRPIYPIIGTVVGATHPEQAKSLLWRMGKVFTLVPGYGAQGATADDVAVNFDEKGEGAIVNSSRGIMNAYKKDCWKDEYSEETWAEAARAEAIRATEEINQAINRLYEEDIC